MPYYHAIIKKPMRVSGERETYAGSIHDRRISFVEDFRFGRRYLPAIGKKPIQLEVFSHDMAVLRVLRDADVVFQHHDFYETDEFETSKNSWTVLNPESLAEDIPAIRTIRLKRGQEYAIYRTSFHLEDHPKNQVRWSPDQETSADEFVDGLFIEAVKRA